MILRYKYIIPVILMLGFFSCSENRDEPVDKETLMVGDYRLFQQTPAWEMAKAVEDGDTARIDELLRKDQSLIDYQEPLYGNTLLMMTIYNQNRATFPFNLLYDNFGLGSPNHNQWVSFCHLLKRGASTNIPDKWYYGQTALLLACSDFIFNIDYVRKLLDYGAEVNYIQPYHNIRDVYDDNKTALMCAIQSDRFDIVKLLVNHGADINIVNGYSESALGLSFNDLDVVLYLLKHGADCSVPTSKVMDHYVNNECDDSTSLYIADELRFYTEELNTRKHKIKMEIVALLKAKGINYHKTKIPDRVIKEAKKKYPQTWRNYLQKY